MMLHNPPPSHHREAIVQVSEERDDKESVEYFDLEVRVEQGEGEREEEREKQGVGDLAGLVGHLTNDETTLGAGERRGREGEG